MNWICCPSRKTLKSVRFSISVLEIMNLTYPVVSEGPLALKLISFEVELKANDDNVELDSAKNKASPVPRATLMLARALKIS